MAQQPTKTPSQSVADFGAPVSAEEIASYMYTDPFRVPKADPNYHYYHALESPDIVQGARAMEQRGYENCEAINGRSMLPGHVLMRKRKELKDAEEKFMNGVVDKTTREINRKATLKQSDGFTPSEIERLGGMTHGSIR